MNLRTDFINPDDKHFKTIFFKAPTLNTKKALINEITYFLNKYHFTSKNHVFIVGLGNEAHTADSVGPKTLKHIKATSHLKKLGITFSGAKISTLEPGTTGTTGISSKKIIKSIIGEIKPDLLIVIDSFVTDKLEHLNHTIQISDKGITPGSGVLGNNEKINKASIGIPVIAIGIATALEYTHKTQMLVATSDIDIYVQRISWLIGDTLNDLFHNL